MMACPKLQLSARQRQSPADVRLIPNGGRQRRETYIGGYTHYGTFPTTAEMGPAGHARRSRRVRASAAQKQISDRSSAPLAPIRAWRALRQSGRAWVNSSARDADGESDACIPVTNDRSVRQKCDWSHRRPSRFQPFAARCPSIIETHLEALYSLMIGLQQPGPPLRFPALAAPGHAGAATPSMAPTETPSIRTR